MTLDTTDYESDAFEHATTVGVISRRILRRAGPGPTVILMHEYPGILENTLDIASRLHDRGFTVVLPELLDLPPDGPSKRNFLRICIAREFSALTSGETGAIAEWLRALAKREWTANDAWPIGVVGMCMSGGFALATAVEPKVRAVVMSQPALPMLSSDLGLNARDLGTVRTNVGTGECIRVLRYRFDFKSPGGRMRNIRRAFPDADTVQIRTWDPRKHSVLRDGRCAEPGSDLAVAFDGTIEFLEGRLGWPVATD